MDKQTVTDPNLLASALQTLSNRQKVLDPKWFYDHRGSELFEDITKLPEYYPTRTETAILSTHARRIAANITDGAVLIELGSGASVKTRLLLDAAPQLATYAPVDISAQFLQGVAAQLQTDYLSLEVTPIVADFMSPISLPAHLLDRDLIVFFPGSTIGNLTSDAAIGLLRSVRDLGRVRAMVVGADLAKDATVLVDAYDDATGTTAAFNKNLLYRLNREAGANFDVEKFHHEARWNEDLSRIEMHLVSRTTQIVDLGGRSFHFMEGESIHTENSHKYTRNSLSELAEAGGWYVTDWLTDPQDLFSVSVLVPH
ncbi:L-histidine N(alpha)-methyltransferase [Shimia sp.]|uniref:L-histidine N(alpha)-methyltransferase n=1 Tax=Shimia sp. TaxID=1954381 RepID=UPI003B8CE175